MFCILCRITYDENIDTFHYNCNFCILYLCRKIHFVFLGKANKIKLTNLNENFRQVRTLAVCSSGRPCTGYITLEIDRVKDLIGFYRASIYEGGLGSRNSVRPSVCLSVTRVHCELNDALQIFLYHTKGQHSVSLITRVVGRRRPLPSEICAQSDPPPSKNADFDRFPLITSQQ